MELVSRGKILLWIAGGVIAGCAVFWAVREFYPSGADARSRARLNRIATELNRSVPVMIDQETELMPVEGAQGILIYNYRLVHYSIGQIDRVRFAAGAKPQLVRTACNTPATRDDFLSQGVTLRYAYYDKDKKHIATVDVTPADCRLQADRPAPENR